MNQIEISPNLFVTVGMSPKEAELAIVSAAQIGTPGNLNVSVLKEYGYSEKDLPTMEQLSPGFFGLDKEGKKTILFVVTVSELPTETNLEKNLYNTLAEFRGWFRQKKVWVPLMGTGAGNLDFRTSFSITKAVIERFFIEYGRDAIFYISVPESSEGIEMFNRITAEQSIVNQKSTTAISSPDFSEPPNLFLAGAFWSGSDQTSRFLENGIWENGHDEKFTDLVSSVKSGDIVFLKSTFAQEEISYLRIKAVGLVVENTGSGYELRIDWKIKLSQSVDIEHLGKYRRAFARVMDDDVETIINAIGRERIIELHPGIIIVLESKNKLKGTENEDNFDRKTWFLKIFGINWQLPAKVGDECFFNSHFSSREQIPNQDNFRKIKPGDVGVAYDCSLERGMVFLFEITLGLHVDNVRGEIFTFKITHSSQKAISISEIGHPLSFADKLEDSHKERLFELPQIVFARILKLFKPPTVSQVSYLVNTLQKPNYNNDGLQGEKDLLGFEQDIRAFASLIALKDLKPPLAIALFGEWGSGKSFFMRSLQKKINLLSKYQGFEEVIVKTEGGDGQQEPFCRGVVQISFNAWSYMDANLWAGLVSNIFEKLDEYIQNEGKGDREKKQAMEVLNKNLAIVNEEKEKIVQEQKVLINEKNKLIGRIEEIEREKNSLKDKVANKTLEQIYEEIKKKLPLEETIKEQLAEYGISKAEIELLDPNSLFLEVRSWFEFVKNMFSFSKTQIWFLILGLAVLAFAIVNPGHILDRYLAFSQAAIISFFTLIGPFLFNLFQWLKKLKKIYEPIRAYKNQFNQEFARIKSQYQEDIKKTNEALETKLLELRLKETKITDLNNQIQIIEGQMIDSGTGKAFFEFIKNKRDDEQYSKSLSIITTIRRDFETLSELFQDYNIPKGVDTEEREKAQKRKQEIEEFQNLFNKPLDRIILYVDDLDRCTEDRVVEVLEAVNLLMAFPLFVVVVGVDPRWVKGALIKRHTLQFTGILGNKELITEYGISPINVTDYLEKIFQIPFHLHEADPNGVNNLIQDMLGNQVKKEEPKRKEENLMVTSNGELNFGRDSAETGTDPNLQTDSSDTAVVEKVKEETKLARFQPKDLQISQQELDDLKTFAWLVGPNPRALKRYVNIYRIIRAHEGLRYEESNERTNFLCIMILIGLCIGDYRGIAKEFCHYCTTNNQELLDSLFTSLKNEKGVDDFKMHFNTTAIPHLVKTIKLEEFDRYIPFVKRFSFDNPSHANTSL